MLLLFSHSSCPTFYYPMDSSTPGFPVHYQILELAQTCVHRVGDAIQSSHPLSFPSPLGLTGFISLLSKNSPTPQFKSINSAALSFLYIPSLTSIHDYWKNHSLDYTDLFWQLHTQFWAKWKEKQNKEKINPWPWDSRAYNEDHL